MDLCPRYWLRVMLLTILSALAAPPLVPTSTLPIHAVTPDAVVARPEPSTEEQSAAASLTVATWNVGFLATNTKARARPMGQLVSSLRADVLGLNEGINPPEADRFLEAATAAGTWQVAARRQPPADGDKIFNGGLGLLVKKPLLAGTLSTHIWSKCTNLGGTFDCPAAKGALFTRVKLTEDLSVNIFVVHLNAGHAHGPFLLKDVYPIRLAQLSELRTFVDTLSEGYPTIVMGDFNIVGACFKPDCNPPEEELAIKEAGGLLGELATEALGKPVDTFLVECPVTQERCPTVPYGGSTFWKRKIRLDYILYYPDTSARRPWKVEYIKDSHTVREMNTNPSFTGNRPGPGSDHYSISASFRFVRAQ